MSETPSPEPVWPSDAVAADARTAQRLEREAERRAGALAERLGVEPHDLQTCAPASLPNPDRDALLAIRDLTSRASALRSKVMVAQTRAFLDDPDEAAARRWWLARY